LLNWRIGMKGTRLAILVLFLCLPVSLFAQGLLPGGSFDLPVLAKNIKVNTYAQAGFQLLGSNLNLPVQAERFVAPDFNLEIGDLDISLHDANFWSGIAGFSILFQEKYSLFASASGLLKRQFITSGTVPVSVGALGTPVYLEFTNTNVESWSIQTGIGLGPALVGFYWDHFAFQLVDPRNAAGPLPNQTLQGDFLTKTFAPFFGLALPAYGATLTVTYSPWAYSDTNLSLRSSLGRLTELRYSWNKPGDLINAMLQYNTPITSAVQFGIWANGSWMRMRQGANLEFTSSAPLISRSKQVTATMTKYLAGVGITLGVNF
jgi:hypothetical protein